MAENSLKRDIILLFVGAVISTSTALFTNTFNQNREDKRENVIKKLELNDVIAKDLGKRMFLSFELHRRKREKDSISFALSKYKEAKENWNLKYYSYLSLLSYYYGTAIQHEFSNKVYGPMIEFGKSAENSKLDTLFVKEHSELQNENLKFITKLYALTEK